LNKAGEARTGFQDLPDLQENSAGFDFQAAKSYVY
jgi:hypothetical protein